MITAIIYHYCEVDLKYKDNFIFFLSTAIRQQAEYFVYISGPCSVELPVFPNVRYKYIENKNHDFGGIVDFFKSEDVNLYTAFLFVNSSVRGPFLPNYITQNWDEIFTSRLSDNVGIVGSSINFLHAGNQYSQSFKRQYGFAEPYIHVQTTAYAISQGACLLLLKKGFFELTDMLEKNDLINRYEILLSQILMHNDYAISSILPTQEKITLSNKGVELNKTSMHGDSLYRNAFYGRSVSPFESLFVKTNRNMISEKGLASFTFTSLVKKYYEGYLTQQGVDLFKRSSNLLLESDVEKINSNQLISMLKNIKIANPRFAQYLRQYI
jgi:hypothetical protein